MACKLEKEGPSAIEGTTLFSTSNCNRRPIGVYLPKVHNFEKSARDIVIWLHGYFIAGQKELLPEDNLKSSPEQKIELRKQIKDSGKDVVLVARRCHRDDLLSPHRAHLRLTGRMTQRPLPLSSATNELS